MKKKLVLALVLTAAVVALVFADLSTAVIHDASVTPIPEWVRRKMARGEMPVGSGPFSNSGPDGSWPRRAGAIVDRDRVAWCYFDETKRRVYVFTYVPSDGRNWYFVYFQ